MPEDDGTLVIELPRNEDQIVYIANRTSDDLPDNIRGVARWAKHRHSRKNSYEIKIKDMWYPVEYINHEWWYITWSDLKTSYAFSGEDKIPTPNLLGLGTKLSPFEPREVETDETDKAQTQEPEQDEEELDQDTPTITRQQSALVDELVEKLKERSTTNLLWTAALVSDSDFRSVPFRSRSIRTGALVTGRVHVSSRDLVMSVFRIM